MADAKQFELIYSRQKTDFIPGRAYANPRFYTRPREGVTKVFIVGNWPKIEADYKALGVAVERLDAAPAAPDVEAVKGAQAGGRGLVSGLSPEERSAVEIPDDWKDMRWFALRGLATKFADAPVLNKVDAVAAIEAELARRAGEAETQAGGAE